MCQKSDSFFFFFLIVVHLCVFLIFSNPFYCRPHTLFLSFPSPADPLCRPANGGCAREDEGEESADRRAGHACNTSQRKSLTPWAEAGKTVILFFFLPPSFSPSPVPAQWELGWAKLSRGSRTNICEKSAVDSLWATGSTQQPSFCKWALDICVSAQRTTSIRQRPFSAKLIYSAATLPHFRRRPGVIRQMLTLMFKLDFL